MRRVTLAALGLTTYPAPPRALQVLSAGAAAVMTLSVAGAAFAEGATTLPQLVDDTKLNAGVQLIYEARAGAAPRRGRPALARPGSRADARA